jgi:hypothetical protein
MFGLSYAKFDSVTYVMQYRNGPLVREGRGLAFFYATLGSSIAAVPLGSNDLPFISNETTADYQSISIQGQLTSMTTPKSTLRRASLRPPRRAAAGGRAPSST